MAFTRKQIQQHHDKLRKARAQEAAAAESHRKRHGLSIVEAATTKAQRTQLVQDTMARALNGDPRAIDLMIARVAAPIRPQAPPVKFDLDLADAPSASRSILQAVAEGTLTVDQGKDLLAGLNSATQIGELQRLAQEVADLRAHINARPQPVLSPPVNDDQDDDQDDTPEQPAAWEADW